MICSICFKDIGRNRKLNKFRFLILGFRKIILDSFELIFEFRRSLVNEDRFFGIIGSVVGRDRKSFI